MCLFGDIRNSVHKKSHGIPRNFSQFRTEYGIDGSKKTGGIPCRRNTEDTITLRLKPTKGFDKLIITKLILSTIIHRLSVYIYKIQNDH
jgi:hypothetical protein